MRARGCAPRIVSDREAEARGAGGRWAAGAPRGRVQAYQLPAIVSTGLNAPCSTL
ncbi:hypothetical protein BPA30113_06942 [Burkholderia paludis]|uniref:Uncharacterized protein n=1 Tax=Burkholderia paludis TaxID=1506587 RepID=A0A6P2RV47_9BURK|nr:hypothetical protein LMG30113_06421 [Burkholderia paludis]VWC41343.1 hypothetical protein BPA30113_06942 [Burkholderia paludis]